MKTKKLTAWLMAAVMMCSLPAEAVLAAGISGGGYDPAEEIVEVAEEEALPEEIPEEEETVPEEMLQEEETVPEEVLATEEEAPSLICSQDDIYKEDFSYPEKKVTVCLSSEMFLKGTPSWKVSYVSSETEEDTLWFQDNNIQDIEGLSFNENKTELTLDIRTLYENGLLGVGEIRFNVTFSWNDSVYEKSSYIYVYSYTPPVSYNMYLGEEEFMWGLGYISLYTDETKPFKVSLCFNNLSEDVKKDIAWTVEFRGTDEDVKWSLESGQSMPGISFDDDKTTFYLDVPELKKEGRLEEDGTLHFQAKVRSGTYTADVDVKTPYIDYYSKQDNGEMVLGEEKEIPKTCWQVIYNAENATGKFIDYSMDRLEISSPAEDSSNDPVIEISREDKDNWYIHALKEGTATLRMIYTEEGSGKEAAFECQIEVKEMIWRYMVVSGPHNILPGNSVVLAANITREICKDKTRVEEIPEDVTYRWEILPIESWDDYGEEYVDLPAGFSLENAEGNNVTLRASAEAAEEATVKATAYYKGEVVGEDSYRVSIEKDQYIIEGVPKEVSLEAGQSWTFNPTVKLFNTEHLEGLVMENWPGTGSNGEEYILLLQWSEDKDEVLEVDQGSIISSDTKEGYSSYQVKKAFTITLRKNTDVMFPIYVMKVWTDDEGTCREFYAEKIVRIKNGTKTHTHSWDKGKVTKEASCTEAGEKTYTCSTCKETKTEVIPKTAHKMVTVIDKAATCGAAGKQHKECSVCHGQRKNLPDIPATGKHRFGNYVTTKAATALAAGLEVRTCSVCKKKESRAIKKLTPVLQLNVNVKSTLSMKTGQSYSGLKVTKMAKGDYVASWKSSNTKVLKVTGKKDGTCTLKAQKKAGTVNLTITLKSGKKVTLKVKVANAAVKTTKITVPKTKITMKRKAKYTLKPVLTPITSTEKITYASSNKNVVAVSSKGVLTAKKKGTATITVRSGKKNVKVKVTVK